MNIKKILVVFLPRLLSLLHIDVRNINLKLNWQMMMKNIVNLKPFSMCRALI